MDRTLANVGTNGNSIRITPGFVLSLVIVLTGMAGTWFTMQAKLTDQSYSIMELRTEVKQLRELLSDMKVTLAADGQKLDDLKAAERR